jgi:methylated-DNA-protein-cysteine methyltransferase-like protein
MRKRAKTSAVETPPVETSPFETPPFERVQDLVRRIPRGKVATYGQLSRMIERRLTPVGVGWAIRAAPEGSIPWQRVVNAQGGISTDGGDHPGLQRAMLEAEGVRFGRDGRVDLARHGWAPVEE